MSQKKIVCHGAICKCQFGDVPDTITVLSQQKNYINDSAGSQKLIATDKELGMPFQAKTFGQCKMQPTGSSFKPCMPNITKWDGAFQKTQLKANQGYPLLEDSKATCSFGGSPCVEITFHGQTAAASAQNAENADQELLSQVLPINAKEIDQPSPYDAVYVDDDSDQKKQKEETIAVEITLNKDTFVPLGIKDYQGTVENDKLNFTISIKENLADKMVVQILDNGKSYFKEEISDPNMMTIGDHKWQWDGFDNWDNLNTEFLKNASLEAQVTVWYKGIEEFDIISIKEVKSDEVDWVDLNIQRNIKEIQVTLRVHLKDGGAKGLNKSEKVPQSRIKHFNKQPLNSQIVSYNDLKKLTLHGLQYHWSRNSKHPEGKFVTINGEKYQVTLKAINQPQNSIKTPKIIFITNKPPGRSRNWELSRILFYNIGYLEYSNGWLYESKNYANEEFKETGAHEIGHEVLLACGGHDHSKSHKGSSTILTQRPLRFQKSHPTSGEIDLMKYYQNSVGHNYKKNVIASDKDVLGLLWLNKLKIG
ncbi:DUF4280 domain-containing protein [Tamlana sp. 2_MG-2023]|uniref:DUF4280 domain-containing protein n=1 Tax=unclassified Tamlana TaxID=2614803 RepID=UPI0026E2ED69|nr:MULTISPECIES: DUF4280 domain-containing protein [unclassified Tamlana]MDO6761661.1 DUF4280 domain-containing protein [Tamlana sp. 2_MG-2023]MDO6792487.1 DUF4280 domain-containing protein [Tamlana sp. 1_MG-2023]